MSKIKRHIISLKDNCFIGDAGYYCTCISGDGRKIYSVYEFWNNFVCNFINTRKNNRTGGEML